MEELQKLISDLKNENPETIDLVKKISKNVDFSMDFYQQKLKEYPNIFGKPPFNPKETLIGFGFECGPGWSNILDDVFAKISTAQKENFLDFKIVQVKEKFGGLRIYYRCSDGRIDIVDQIISEAVKLASKTCEQCGSESELKSYEGWFTTKCEKCRLF